MLDRASEETGGLAVVAELRARGDRTPVVLMSGSFLGTVALPSRVWHLSKPLTPEQLAVVVRVALSADPDEG